MRLALFIILLVVICFVGCVGVNGGIHGPDRYHIEVYVKGSAFTKQLLAHYCYEYKKIINGQRIKIEMYDRHGVRLYSVEGNVDNISIVIREYI